VASEEEQAIIFEQMESCIETFRQLNIRLRGTAEGLPTPIGLPQSTLSNVQQQLEGHIGDDSAIVTVDVDKTSKKSTKPDDSINMSSEAFHTYLENHITDEHYYKEWMSIDLRKIEHD